METLKERRRTTHCSIKSTYQKSNYFVCACKPIEWNSYGTRERIIGSWYQIESKTSLNGRQSSCYSNEILHWSSSISCVLNVFCVYRFIINYYLFLLVRTMPQKNTHYQRNSRTRFLTNILILFVFSVRFSDGREGGSCCSTTGSWFIRWTSTWVVVFFYFLNFVTRVLVARFYL